jgi:hypothetical protein
LTAEEAQELAHKLSWEPPGHNGLPGLIPDHAWDHWRRFAEIAERAIAWTPVNAAVWRTKHATDWSPAFEAVIDGCNILLVQHDWHGFPDPPEWALHILQGNAAVSLGCFDNWPEAWSVAGDSQGTGLGRGKL